MERKYGFCVDNDSNPESVDNAIYSLRRLVRLGKLAKHILNELKTKQKYEGRAPILHNRGYSRKKFPSFVPITKDIFPEYADVEIKFTESGLKRARVYIVSHIIRQYDDNDPIEKFKASDDRNFGSIEFNRKSTIKFIGKRNFRFFKKIDSNNANSSIRVLAYVLSKRLVTIDCDHPFQWVRDLQSSVEEWLIEDGIAKRIYKEMLYYVFVSSIMNS